MNAAAFYRKLNEKIPESLRCEWDNDGLMVCSDPGREVKKVLITLDCTDDAVSYADENDFDLIVSHHPLIFHPLKAVTDPKLIQLIKRDIPVFSFHTRLDAVKGGVNDTLASLLGLEDVVSFGEDGMGRIGFLPDRVPFDAFVSDLKDLLGVQSVTAVRCTGSVDRVAVLGGSGKDYIADAEAAGADTFVTGEAGYNALTDASEGTMNVILAGHYFTEQPVCQTLRRMLLSIDPKLETEIYECNKLLQY